MRWAALGTTALYALILMLWTNVAKTVSANRPPQSDRVIIVGIIGITALFVAVLVL